MAKQVERGARRPPRDFIETFEPKANDFAISISKVFPPKVKNSWAKNAYLIKLRLVLYMSADDWKYFTELVDTLKKEKMFCGIWTPDIGEVVIDDYRCYAEMISYLRTGTEERLMHLDKVIRASPSFDTGSNVAVRSDSDARFVETFVDRVKAGDGLEKAMETTQRAVPSDQPVEALTKTKYVIGNLIVVQGGVADKLVKAEKRVEEELEDDD